MGEAVAARYVAGAPIAQEDAMDRPLRPTPRSLLVAVAGAAATVPLVAAPAGAHTGLPAGGALDGVVHPLAGLDHLLAMVAVGVLAALAGTRRAAWAVPAGFVGGMVLGGAAGLAGVELPAVEVLIAASVVVLGVLVAVGVEGSATWLPLVAVAMGAVHGHAHGAELPAGAAPVAYVAGFVVATAALHATGAAAGLGLRRLPVVRVGAGATMASVGALLLLAG